MPIHDKKEQTGYSVILISREGDRTILTYRGAASAMKTVEIPLKKLKSKWVYIVPSDMSYDALRKIFEHFHKTRTQIAIDPSKHFIKMGAQKLKPLLKMVKLFKLNREEAAYLTGVAYENEQGIFKKLDELIGGIAVMTDGKKGVTVSDGHTLFHAPFCNPLDNPGMTVFGRQQNHPTVPGTPVLNGPAQHIEIAVSRQLCRHSRVPGYALGSSPAQHRHCRCESTRVIPRTRIPRKLGISDFL